MVLVSVVDVTLADLLSSQVLLAQAWPTGHSDAMVLLEVLRHAAPALTAALAVGLIELLIPRLAEPSSLIIVRHRLAVLTAIAEDGDGAPVVQPHLHPDVVRRLAITDLTVGGRSGLSVAI